MPSTQLPGIGLYKGWDNGEKGWGDQVNENFCKLDALLAVCITDQILTADLPATANQGQQFFLTDTNEIATYQGSTFLKCPAPKGIAVFNQATGGIIVNDGTQMVDPNLVIPTAVLADLKAGTPSLYVTSDLIVQCIEEQITTLNTTLAVGVVDPTVAPGPLDLPFYCNTSSGEFFIWTGTIWKSGEIDVETITAFDVGGAGASSAAKIVETTSEGCIDRSFMKHHAQFDSDGQYELSIGGAANLTGGEIYYNNLTGQLMSYDAVNGIWCPLEPNEYIEAVNTSFVTMGNALSVFQNPDVTWTISLPPGTWEIGVRGNHQFQTDGLASFGQMSVSTSSTPGTAIFGTTITGNDESNGAAGIYTGEIFIPEYTTTTAVDLFVEFRINNIIGATSASTHRLRNDFGATIGGGGRLWARRIK